MGLREQMNEKPGLTAGIVGVIILLALVWMFKSGGGGGGPAVTGDGMPEKAFFSDDDGKTWFPDDARKIPPFDHGGKQAVQAYVFASGGKEAVHYMRRFTPEAKKKLEELVNTQKLRNDPTLMQSIQATGEEVKRPGQEKWVKASDRQYMEVIRPPEGSEMVSP